MAAAVGAQDSYNTVLTQVAKVQEIADSAAQTAAEVKKVADGVGVTMDAGVVKNIVSEELMESLKGWMEMFYPVGSIFIGQQCMPQMAGVGKWVAVEAGRTLVAAGTGFTAGATGGADTHTLTVEELPAHSHAASTGEAGWHGHAARTDTANLTGSFNPGGLGVTASGICSLGANNQNSNRNAYHDSCIVNINASHAHNVGVDGSGNHTHTVNVQATGSGRAFSTRDPYLVVNMWRRTA